jgi:hypothetical protein
MLECVFKNLSLKNINQICALRRDFNRGGGEGIFNKELGESCIGLPRPHMKGGQLGSLAQAPGLGVGAQLYYYLIKKSSDIWEQP